MDSKIAAVSEATHDDVVVSLASALFPVVLMTSAIRQSSATPKEMVEYSFMLSTTFLAVVDERDEKARSSQK